MAVRLRISATVLAIAGFIASTAGGLRHADAHQTSVSRSKVTLSKDKRSITYELDPVGDTLQRRVAITTYALVGTEAVPSVEVNSHPVARRVVSACFSSLNQTVTATITVEARPDDPISVTSLMRLPQ